MAWVYKHVYYACSVFVNTAMKAMRCLEAFDNINHQQQAVGLVQLMVHRGAGQQRLSLRFGMLRNDHRTISGHELAIPAMIRSEHRSIRTLLGVAWPVPCHWPCLIVIK